MNKVELTVKKEYMTDVMNILGQMNLSATTQYKTDEVVVSLQLSEEQYTKLNAALLKYKAGNVVKTVVNGVIGGAISAVEFGAKSVAVPAVKLAGHVGASAVRVAAESGVIAGSSLINVACNSYKEAANNLANNSEVQEAKRELKEAKSKLFGFCSRKLKSGIISVTKI